MNVLRWAVRWGMAARLPGELIIMLCLASGTPIPAPLRHVADAATLMLAAGLATLFAVDYRRRRGSGLAPAAAALAAVRDTVPLVLRRLTAHELRLFTSFVRWVTRRPPHGVGAGDLAAPYASGQSLLMYGFLFASVMETVALALVIPWPVVRAVFLMLDVWGCYVIIALHASCVVRPHVIAADGSLRLRYGVLLEIAVPADRIRHVRRDPRSRGTGRTGGMARPRQDGVVDLAVGSQTNITVELTAPVGFIRPLGKRAEASVLRFYADDPAPALLRLDNRPKPRSSTHHHNPTPATTHNSRPESA